MPAHGVTLPSSRVRVPISTWRHAAPAAPACGRGGRRARVDTATAAGLLAGARVSAAAAPGGAHSQEWSTPTEPGLGAIHARSQLTTATWSAASRRAAAAASRRATASRSARAARGRARGAPQRRLGRGREGSRRLGAGTTSLALTDGQAAGWTAAQGCPDPTAGDRRAAAPATSGLQDDAGRETPRAQLTASAARARPPARPGRRGRALRRPSRAAG